MPGMANDRIVVRGAREHNLKSIDLEIPRDQLVVITGLSGSGKSSLAFDTIYAEGQRRYVESLSAYARQFLEQMEKPDVDSIEGLSPAISIEQKTTSRNPRSTVGTVTEIYDYLRVLFARVGVPHCPRCGRPIAAQTVQQMVDRVMTLPAGSRLLVLAPVVRGRKGEYRKLFWDLRRQGYVRVRVNGALRELSEDIELAKQKKHTIEVVVDRLVVRDNLGSRLNDSLETALRLAEGVVQVEVVDGPALVFSERLACAGCGVSFPEVSPRLFSFNSPYGACPGCGGIGTRQEVDPALVVPDGRRSLKEGALAPWAHQPGGLFRQTLQVLARRHRFALDTPVGQAPAQGARDHPARRAGGRLRGRDQDPRAALPGNDVGGDAAGGRALHGAPRLPGLRGVAAAPGGPGGEDRRPLASATSCASRSARPPSSSTPWRCPSAT